MFRPGANNLREFHNLPREEKTFYYYTIFITIFIGSIIVTFISIVTGNFLFIGLGLLGAYLSGTGLNTANKLRKKSKK